jgi:hypothetical protein
MKRFVEMSENLSVLTVQIASQAKSKSKLEQARATLRGALKSEYRHLTMIRNYSLLNATAFTKLVKKFNKNCPAATIGSEFFNDLDGCYFVQSTKVVLAMDKSVQMYMLHFPEGIKDDKQAKEHLIGKQTSEAEHRVNLFRLGMVLGFCIAVMLVTVYDLSRELPSAPHVKFALTVFRIMGGLSLFSAGLAGNVYIYRSKRINYPFIFGLNSKSNLHYYQYLEISSYVFLVMTLSLWSYVKASVAEASAGVIDSPWPYVWIWFPVASIFLAIINPFKLLFYETRVFFMGVIMRIFLSPFFKVRFIDSFAADQMTSLTGFFVEARYAACATVAKDTKFTSCSLKNDWVITLVALWPNVIRAFQTLRQAYDLTKQG